jgi:hypothetical protein
MLAFYFTDTVGEATATCCCLPRETKDHSRASPPGLSYTVWSHTFTLSRASFSLFFFFFFVLHIVVDLLVMRYTVPDFLCDKCR